MEWGAEGEPGEKPARKLELKFGLPGFWGYQRTKDYSSTSFLPFYYRYKDSETSIEHFWPVYGRKVRKNQFTTHYSLWPFLRHTTYADGATQVDCPWPFVSLYGSKNYFRAHVFPLLWVSLGRGKEGKVVIFPLYWHVVGERSRTTLLLPFYWDIKDEKHEYRHLWPLAGWSSGLAGKNNQFRYSQFMLGFPLLRYTRRWDASIPVEEQAADRQVDLLWPLVKMRFGPYARQFRLFPFYWGKTYYKDREDGKTKLETRTFYLLPFFLYHSNRDATYFHLWPYGVDSSRDGDEKRYHFAFPLLAIHKIKPIDYVKVSVPFWLALFSYESKAQTVHFKDQSTRGRSLSIRLYPLFSYRSSPDKKQLSINPLFTYTREVKPSRDVYTRLSVVGGLAFLRQSLRSKLSWQVMFRVATYDRNEAGDKRFRLLWWTCEWERKKSYYQFEPVFRYSSGEEGYDFRVLTGLFGFGRRKDNKYLRLFWIKF